MERKKTQVRPVCEGRAMRKNYSTESMNLTRLYREAEMAEKWKGIKGAGQKKKTETSYFS